MTWEDFKFYIDELNENIDLINKNDIKYLKKFKFWDKDEKCPYSSYDMYYYGNKEVIYHISKISEKYIELKEIQNKEITI